MVCLRTFFCNDFQKVANSQLCNFSMISTSQCLSKTRAIGSEKINFSINDVKLLYHDIIQKFSWPQERMKFCYECHDQMQSISAKYNLLN